MPFHSDSGLDIWISCISYLATERDWRFLHALLWLRGGPPCRGPSFLWHICRKPCACEGNRIYGGCLSMLPDQRINNDKCMAMDQSFQTGRGDDWCHILKRNSNRNLADPIAAAARLIILFFDFYMILVRWFLNKMILFFDFYLIIMISVISNKLILKRFH